MTREDARIILRDYISPRSTEMTAFVTCRAGSVEIDREELLSEIENEMTFNLDQEDLSDLDNVHRFVMYCNLDGE